MTFKGFAELKNAGDLFKKLERDHHRLRENPVDQDAAFDFFVTAYHMLEWAYPGDANKAKRSALEGKTVLLQIASHLANGAKHFEATNPKHKSVSSIDKEVGAFQAGAFDPGAFDVGMLEVHLDGNAAAQLGKSIRALPLAEKLLEFWSKELNS